MSLVIISST